MEKHHRLVNDPRIMEPLEEFLRTVREVVRLPRLKGEKVEDPDIEFLTSRKKTVGFNRWW